jgi:hypothetical protein
MIRSLVSNHPTSTKCWYDHFEEAGLAGKELNALKPYFAQCEDYLMNL